MCAAREEACSDAEDVEEDEASSRPIFVKVLVKYGARVAVLDTACYSIWVDKKAFGEMGEYEYDEGGSAWSADGSPLQVAGRGRLDFCLWGQLFRRFRVRVMEILPSKLIIGRQLMIRNGIDLSLGNGTGKFTVLTENGLEVFSGSIRYRRRGGDEEEIAGVDEQRDIEDTLEAIENLDLGAFGVMEDREAKRAVLTKYVDVFSAGTGTVPGREFKIEKEEGADMSKLNRLAPRKSPMEQDIERREMRKLLARGIVKPSKSPFGTANIVVPKNPLQDGTPGGLRVTADMRAVNYVTIGDAFPTEDIQVIVSWLVGKVWYRVVDLRDGYWNV
jgi:hypothetical protein